MKKELKLKKILRIGDWVTLKDGRTVRIDADDMPNLPYENIKRYATEDEIKAAKTDAMMKNKFKKGVLKIPKDIKRLTVNGDINKEGYKFEELDKPVVYLAERQSSNTIKITRANNSYSWGYILENVRRDLDKNNIT